MDDRKVIITEIFDTIKQAVVLNLNKKILEKSEDEKTFRDINERDLSQNNDA